MELNMTPAAEHTSGVTDAASSTEVVAVAKRRKFTMAYMQRIVREADACTAPGAIGALLRSEGLYSSHLSKWRLLVAGTHFLTIGLEQVKTEMSLHVLAYNFKRLITLLGIADLMAAVTPCVRIDVASLESL
jgi:hypothetical protein